MMEPNTCPHGLYDCPLCVAEASMRAWLKEEQTFADDDESEPEKCTACGVPFVNHHGIVGTCRKLQQAIAEIDALHKTILAMAERIAGQSEHLAKLASKGTP